jgi:hypothetical protein
MAVPHDKTQKIGISPAIVFVSLGFELRNNSTPTPFFQMNYLRQMMFCRSRAYLDPLLGYPQPNGYPDTDQCPDWSVVYDEVQRNRQRCGK